MAEQPTQSERLVSLDAYRGLVMLAMASGGLHLAHVFSDPEVVQRYDNSATQGAWRWLCSKIVYNSEHVAWAGGGFWDMIQPSFMFMVGVALPFSFASRSAQGQSGIKSFLHVLMRSLILILLGVFLSSNNALHTRFTFVNVLTQIGLGYPILWLMLRRGTALQLTAIALILGGYWYAFFQHPAPPPNLDRASVGLPADWPLYDGIAGHWNKNTNWAAAVDQTLLNLFPQYDREGQPALYRYNDGGYQTLNFIPSIATMLIGLMTGELLRGPLSPRENTWRMIWTGGLCLVLGLALDPRMAAPVPLSWTLCPIVKRIWTPSWVLYSSGWTLWMLAAFYYVIDVKGWKSWAFPLAIVGMNSIAIYVGAQLLKPWVIQTLKTHISQDLFEGKAGPILASAAFVLVLWLICLWMYRRRIFVRI